MSLGFQNAGFKIVAAYDNWAPAAKIYAANFSHKIYTMDLSDPKAVDHIGQFRPEVIIGGPPCQDFSIANLNYRKSNCKSKRANLTVTFGQIVAKILPDWVVMENVYNIEKSPVLPEVTRILNKAGYRITNRVLDASTLGVPQARKRFFLIGNLHAAEDGFLTDFLNRDISKKRTTVFDYLGNSLGTEYYYSHPRSYNRRAVFSIHEPSSTIRGVNRPIPNGYKKHPADKMEISRRVRTLTARERSYIQTFPKWFKFVGSKTEVEQAIGNAVPVKMAEFVALHVLECESRMRCAGIRQ